MAFISFIGHILSAPCSGHDIAVFIQLALLRLRLVEAQSRLVGVGGYAPARYIEHPGERAQFAVNIIFQNAGKTESINISPNLCGGPTCDDDAAPQEVSSVGPVIDVPFDPRDD